MSARLSCHVNTIYVAPRSPRHHQPRYAQLLINPLHGRQLYTIAITVHVTDKTTAPTPSSCTTSPNPFKFSLSNPAQMLRSRASHNMSASTHAQTQGHPLGISRAAGPLRPCCHNPGEALNRAHRAPSMRSMMCRYKHSKRTPQTELRCGLGNVRRNALMCLVACAAASSLGEFKISKIPLALGPYLPSPGSATLRAYRLC